MFQTSLSHFLYFGQRPFLKGKTRMTWLLDLKNYFMIIPIFTEKSTRILENNQYTFDVDPNLTKQEIRKFVEESFKVKVVAINTHRPPRKSRRLGQYQGFRPKVKRVMLTLRAGDSIFDESLALQTSKS